MSTNPKVSILVPVFNRENFLYECIESALKQTFKGFELVVIDNCSDDNTWEICQQFASSDCRIKIYRNKENIGPVKNWLKCLEYSRGEYIKFLFSDDLMSPDYLEKTMGFLTDEKIGFVYSAAEIGEETGRGKIYYSNSQEAKFSSKIFLEMLIDRSVPYSPGAALFRRIDVIDNLLSFVPTKKTHPFNDHGAGPDVLLYALVASKYSMVVGLKEPLVFFRAHPGSFTISNSSNRVVLGYVAALMWFFSIYNKRMWVRFSLKQWRSSIKKDHQFESFSDFIKNYDSPIRSKDIYWLSYIKIISFQKKIEFLFNRKFVP